MWTGQGVLGGLRCKGRSMHRVCQGNNSTTRTRGTLGCAQRPSNYIYPAMKPCTVVFLAAVRRVLGKPPEKKKEEGGED